MSQPLGGPVGQSLHQQSWVGTLDMLGGLMEWTNSYFDYYPYDPMNELPGGYSTKIVRGAVYYAEDRLFPVTYRTRWLYPGDRYYFLGFRCARDLAAGEPIPSFSG
jgi:formylglycine-generating enzyme required for sulfatase activity